MMRSVSGITLLLLAALILSGCSPIQRPPLSGGNLRQASGELYFPGVPEWGGVAVSMLVDFAEIDPETHKATGSITWHNFQPQPPEGEPYWKAVDSNARYAFFGADVENGDPNTVVVITEINAKEGWGQGEPGEYAYFWFRDGGDQEPDQWGMRTYSFDPWYEFFPADQPPVEQGYFTLEEMQAEDAVLPLTAELGDLRIER